MRAKIPWAAFLPLLLGQLSTAAVAFYVYPFLPAFISSLGKSPADISFYSGVAESSLLAVEASLAMPVARLSDHWGRRPLYIGMLAWLVITCSALGMSTTVTGIVTWRMLAGLSGVRAISRTMLFEISNDANRVSMLGIFEPVNSVGSLVGRLCGGVFAEPSGRIVDVPLLDLHPYLLPGLVVACMPMCAVFLSLFCLPETIERQSKCDSRPVDRTVFNRALLQPGPLPLLIAQGTSVALDTACNAAVALLSTLSVADGGLGLSLQAISWTLCLQSITYMIIAPWMLRRLIRRHDTLTGLTILVCMWPLVVPAFMLTIYHAKYHPSYVPFDIVLYVLIRVTSASLWPIYDLVVMEISSPELLASSNGWYTIFSAIGGACGPFAFGTIFGHSTQYTAGSLGRQVVWLVMLVVMLIPLPLLRLVKKVTVPRLANYEVLPMEDSSSSTNTASDTHA